MIDTLCNNVNCKAKKEPIWRYSTAVKESWQSCDNTHGHSNIVLDEGSPMINPLNLPGCGKSQSLKGFAACIELGTSKGSPYSSGSLCPLHTQCQLMSHICFWLFVCDYALSATASKD